MQKFSENLINSLIPYGNSNTVVEGIEELKVKVSDKQIGSLLKEIERRLPLIKNQVIDTRNFSRLPVNEYTVQTNVLHLDDAGYQLLESLLDLYKGKMCVGVQESLLDEALYLETLKTLVSKRQDTYTVPIKSFADPQFKELLIVPPFAAQITDYCEAPRQVDGFSKDKLCMYAERRSALRPGSKVKVKVPNFLSKHSKNLTLHYYLESSTEVEEETYLDTFKLSADNSDERRSAVSAWVFAL